MSSSSPSADIYKRYLALLRAPEVNTFNRSIISTIANSVGSNRPHLSHAILVYLTQQYHIQNRNRAQVMLYIDQLILQHFQTSTSQLAPPSKEEASVYIATMKLKATNILKQMFLNHFPEQQATMPTELSQSQQKLWRFLTFMGSGEWDTATSILTCWDPADFMPLMNAGIKVYTATTNNPTDSDKEKLEQFSRLKATIGQRAKDVSTRTRAELQLFQSKIADPGPILRNSKQSTRMWNSGYYDKEFLNTWFSLMREPYISSDKLSIQQLQNASSRTHHQAYIVCYEDSQMIQNVVTADNIRLQNERDKGWHFGTKPRVGQSPLYFIQSQNGPCATMCLVNFLINQSPNTHGPVMRQLYQNTKTLIRNKAYQSLVERHTILHALHHQVLCMDAYRHTIMQQQIEIEDEFDQESDPIPEEENHLVVILPYEGHVWEIDSYDTKGPLDLGLCGESWTTVAVARLQMWYSTTASTEAPVDIQAILNSP